MTSYEFNRQNRQGKEGEHLVYAVFQPAFNVIPAQKWLQDQGVDFLFTDRTSNKTWKVELKTDIRAAHTGNAFIEIVSNDREHLPGWAYSSKADWLLYFLPQVRTIYRVALDVLRVELPAWEAHYKTREIPNNGRGGHYSTIGLLVPIDELSRISAEVIEL